MTYQLPVYSDEELAKATAYPPLQCGNYEFDVINREEGTAKNNAHMEILTFDVFHRGRNKKPMKCYHRFFITPKEINEDQHMRDIKKVKDFLDNIKIPYQANSFSRVVGAKGKANFLVDIYVKDGKDREKFVIADDGFRADAEAPVAPVPTLGATKNTEVFDDDIPF
jgi:hypothetical protein